MPILVKDIMSKPPLTIDWNRTTRDAARLMRKHRKGFLIVTKRGKAIGVLSDSDLIEKVILKSLEPTKVKVKDIMSSPIVVTSPEETILDAVRKIKKSNIHRLPVVSEGRVLGVISLTDIARTSPEMLDLLEYRAKMKEIPIVLRERTTVGFCENCGNYSEKLRVKNGIWFCEKCLEEEE